MRSLPLPLWPLAAAVLAASAARAADPSADTTPTDARTLARVTVTAARPSSLPVEIPTTTEGISGTAVEQAINATDVSDALKYLPSLVVRKRHVGDYDHAVLATRASGTGNSARSLVYADGILLSNLLGNGAEFTPRWGLVTPDEIERVDVLYGPFSAAYAGNSAGTIVDIVTRMPAAFEAHLKLQAYTQDARRHGGDRYAGRQGSASVGSREGGFAWWLHVGRLDNEAQPLVIVRQLVAAGVPGSAGTPVTGAVHNRDHLGRPVLDLGRSAQTTTRQDNAKIKLAYDLGPTLRASVTLGLWRNGAERAADSALRDAAGAAVYSGLVHIDGLDYPLAGSLFAASHGRQEHRAHGLGIKSHTGGAWDWEFTASLYELATDELRASGTTLPGALAGGAGRIVDQRGTGWNTLALKGIWRPQHPGGAHTVEFGAQRDAFELRRLESASGDWIRGPAAAETAAFGGDTTLASLWAQDAWRFAPPWRAVLGGRLEHWQAERGYRRLAGQATAYADRRETSFSPKAALSYQAGDAWTLRASLGRALRYPTVSELFQGGIDGVTGSPTLNDPALRAEASTTVELSAERALDAGVLRMTLFHERTRDALISQPSAGAGSPNTVQNVDRVMTKGVELALQAGDVGLQGLDLSGSLTYADSETVRNDALPASVGKRQPRVPAWRASLLARYAIDARWSASFGARYSGTQYGQLDNTDTNGFAYQGFSRYFVTDLRLQVRLDRQWRASFGIDNLGDATVWAFHPYPQRTFHAELRFDL